jgi:hypothetical protein
MKPMKTRVVLKGRGNPQVTPASGDQQTAGSWAISDGRNGKATLSAIPGVEDSAWAELVSC